MGVNNNYLFMMSSCTCKRFITTTVLCLDHKLKSFKPNILSLIQLLCSDVTDHLPSIFGMKIKTTLLVDLIINTFISVIKKTTDVQIGGNKLY